MASIEVLNATQANVEAPVEIQLSLGNPIYRGPEGKPGKDGVIGRDGKSAYEIAVENGFEGTETEWLESLKGEDGTIGRDGAVGPQGEKGDTPVKGVDYFTEQDIQDIAAQVPQPDLSDYKKVIHLSSGTVLSTEDKQFLQDFADPYISLFENNEITGSTRIHICDIDLYIDDYLMSYFALNYSDNQGYSLWFFSPIELMDGQWLCHNYYYFFEHSKITKNSKPSYADGLQIQNSDYRIYNNGTSIGLNFKYIKDNYATKGYVEDIVRGIETGALKRAVVEELPTEEIDENTIYMVPKAGSLNDAYNEYLYVNTAWEYIGSTEVDLTNYREAFYFNKINTVLNEGELNKLQEIKDTLVQKLTNIGPFYYYPATAYLNFDIYINGDMVDTVALRQLSSNPVSYQVDLYTKNYGEYLNKPGYYWQDTSNIISIGSSLRPYGGDLRVYRTESLEDAANKTIGDNFEYIKNNYVKTTDMPAYLTNSDILAIWNGENN